MYSIQIVLFKTNVYDSNEVDLEVGLEIVTAREVSAKLIDGTCYHMDQVTKLRLPCYLVLLSIDIKTR